MTKNLNIYAPLPSVHQALRPNTSSLALCGLIDSADARPVVKTAIAKAALWTAAELPKLRRADATTTYHVWSHADELRAMTRRFQLENDPLKKAE